MNAPGDMAPDPTETPFTLDASDFVTFVGDRPFPFFEDEGAYGVYGYGHVDKSYFAGLVNEYDEASTGWVVEAEDGYRPADVSHVYARAVEEEYGEWRIGDFQFRPFDGATPITWIAR